MKNNLKTTFYFFAVCAALSIGPLSGLAVAEYHNYHGRQRYMIARYFAPQFYINLETDKLLIEWLCTQLQSKRAELAEQSNFVRFMEETEDEY